MNSDLFFSKTVAIDVKDTADRFGRAVGIVWTTDSTNLNLELLRSGLAWHYKILDNSHDFAQAENLAKMNKTFSAHVRKIANNTISTL